MTRDELNTLSNGDPIEVKGTSGKWQCAYFIDFDPNCDDDGRYHRPHHRYRLKYCKRPRTGVRIGYSGVPRGRQCDCYDADRVRFPTPPITNPEGVKLWRPAQD